VASAKREPGGVTGVDFYMASLSLGAPPHKGEGERDLQMSKLRVNCFAISLDGYGAGPAQTVKEPLGIGGEALHGWFIPTEAFQKMYGKDRGTTGVDNDFARRGTEQVGAWILGRNMFGPVRGPWPDESWKGWWGDNPPYHCDAFVLTHHARKPLVMEGGTTFHFVTGGIHEALDRAKASAKGKDVRLGGGVETVRQYLEEKLIDEMHIAVSPIILGAGEHLFQGIDLNALGYEQTAYVPSEKAAHYVLTKKP
jgi:dihydrofolate reductase